MEPVKIRKIWQVEQDEVVRALTLLHGNRTHAAKELGISIRTLRNKIQEYRARGVEIPESDWGAHGRAKALMEERPVAFVEQRWGGTE